MVPSGPQVPPRPGPLAARNSTAPPDAGTTVRPVVWAKKAMTRPSGDQKGFRAVSVLGRTCDSPVASERTQSWLLSFPSVTTNASRVSSGERTGGPLRESKLQPSGGSSDAVKLGATGA